MLTPAEYQAVSTVPYDIPQFPGPLTVPRNVDAAEAVMRGNAHDERIRAFNEVHDLKNALIRQIVAAVDKQYLAELRDKLTNDIPHSIPDILAYLFKNFADVDVEDVDKEAATLNQMHWDISDPPIVFIALIEELQVPATSAGVPRSESQLIAIGIKIVQHTGDFKKPCWNGLRSQLHGKLGSVLKRISWRRIGHLKRFAERRFATQIFSKQIRWSKRLITV